MSRNHESGERDIKNRARERERKVLIRFLPSRVDNERKKVLFGNFH